MLISQPYSPPKLPGGEVNSFRYRRIMPWAWSEPSLGSRAEFMQYLAFAVSELISRSANQTSSCFPTLVLPTRRSNLMPRSRPLFAGSVEATQTCLTGRGFESGPKCE